MISERDLLVRFLSPAAWRRLCIARAIEAGQPLTPSAIAQRWSVSYATAKRDKAAARSAITAVAKQAAAQ